MWLGHHVWSVRALAAVALAACGSESTRPPGQDAGPPDDAAAEDAAPELSPFVPSPPAEPAPPDFGDCAPWRAVEVGGIEVCEPWPDDGWQDCPSAAEAHFPGEPGCTQIGSACPEGDFPEGLPAGAAVLYVRAGAKAGDGSRDAPFGTIGAALDVAVGGTIVAIGKGTYVEELRLRAGVTLWGACVAETVLRSDDERPVEGVVHIAGADTGVRNLTIGPAARPGVSVTGSHRAAHLQDLVIDGVQYFGLAAFSEGELDAESIVIRATREGELRVFTGQAVWAEANARVSLQRGLVVGSDRSLRTLDGSLLALEDVAVLDPLQLGVDEGRGVEAQFGAHVDLHRVVIERCHDVGLFGVGVDTVIEGDLVLVRDTGSDVDGTAGSGAHLQAGVQATMSRLAVIGNHGSGIGVDGSTLALSDAAVHGTRPDRNGWSGVGVVVFAGGELTLDRASISESSAAGASVETSSTADVRDVWIRDTSPDIRDIGFGLQILQAAATVERVRVTASQGVGIHAYGGLSGSDLVVESTAERPGDGHRGNALLAGTSASDVELTRFEARGNREVSVFAFEEAEVTLHDSAILDTLARACAQSTCRDAPAGTGVGTYSGARVVLDGVLVHGAPLCGLQVAAGGELDFLPRAPPPRGEVSGNVTAGACVPGDYDLSRIVTGVLYRDNGVDIDTTNNPVPEPP